MHYPALMIVLSLLASALTNDDHVISKRYILFPRYTVLQITIGLSVPLILQTRSINLSWCFQSNYDLPYNVTNFEIHSVRSQDDEDFDYDMDRLAFYEYIINLLEGFGLSGEDCLLRTICEIAEVPLLLQTEGAMLEKIFHYLLTPSLDTILSSDGNSTLQHKILVAERYGERHGNCEGAFSGCDISLVDIFTKQFYSF